MDFDDDNIEAVPPPPPPDTDPVYTMRRGNEDDYLPHDTDWTSTGTSVARLMPQATSSSAVFAATSEPRAHVVASLVHEFNVDRMNMARRMQTLEDDNLMLKLAIENVYRKLQKHTQDARESTSKGSSRRSRTPTGTRRHHRRDEEEYYSEGNNNEGRNTTEPSNTDDIEVASENGDRHHRRHRHRHKKSKRSRSHHSSRKEPVHSGSDVVVDSDDDEAALVAMIEEEERKRDARKTPRSREGRRSPAPTDHEGSSAAASRDVEKKKAAHEERKAAAKKAAADKAAADAAAAAAATAAAAAAAASRADKENSTSTPRRTPRASSKKPKKSGSKTPRKSSRKAVAAQETVSPELDGVDSERLGFYTVGKKRIWYIRPADMVTEPQITEPPQEELRIEHVYGYNGRVRHNLFYTDRLSSASRVVYFVAGMGVYFDLNKRVQSVFCGHNEDITCIAQHPTEPIVATGQGVSIGATQPYICVWNYNTMEEIARIPNAAERAVEALAFTADGEYLICCGADDKHTITMWDWQRSVKTPVVRSQGGKESVHGVTCNHMTDGEITFCTFGPKSAKSWLAREIDNKEEKDMAKKKHKFRLRASTLSAYAQTKTIQKAYYAALYKAPTELVLGTSSGDIYVFVEGEYATQVSQAHPGGVAALCMTEDGMIASVGVSDDTLKLWKQDYSPLASLELFLGKAEAVAMDYNNGRIIIGTNKSQIVEVSVTAGTDTTPVVKMSGHSGDVWALSPHPVDPVIVTGGHDKALVAWDYKERQAVPDKRVEFRSSVRSAAFSPDGRHIAVGLKNGKLAIVDYSTFEVKYEEEHRQEQIDAIAYSPNGQLLALGSWDQFVELIDMETLSTLPLRGHTASVTHITFSIDSKYLMTNSRDYEILYWDTQTGLRVDQTVVADVIWHDYTCILGWSVKGIFSKGQDGSDVNACNINGMFDSPDRLVATGDDSGHVNLFKYPVLSKKQPAHRYNGHSSHVTNVRWTHDDTRLFSTGGHDLAVIQWKVLLG